MPTLFTCRPACKGRESGDMTGKRRRLETLVNVRCTPGSRPVAPYPAPAPGLALPGSMWPQRPCDIHHRPYLTRSCFLISVAMCGHPLPPRGVWTGTLETYSGTFWLQVCCGRSGASPTTCYVHDALNRELVSHLGPEVCECLTHLASPMCPPLVCDVLETQLSKQRAATNDPWCYTTEK
jgi:hypothetical protein